MPKSLEELLKEQELELQVPGAEETLEEDVLDSETVDETIEVEEGAYPSVAFEKEKVKGGKGGKAVYPTVDFKKSEAKGGAQQPHLMPKVDFVGEDETTNKKTPTDPESYAKVKPNFDPEVVAQLTREDISDETRANLDSLFAGEEISEEFAAKVREIFEAAVIVTAQEALNAKVDELTEEYENKFETVMQVAEEEVEAYKVELNEKADSYFGYVVEQWMKENKPVVESNIRTELTESFIKGLHNLFVEHYIDVPEDKVDLVQEMVEQLEALAEEKEEILQENLELRNDKKNVLKQFLIKEHTKELSENEKEKFEALAEHLSFDDEETFAEKLTEISEAYFGESLIIESSLEDDTPLEIIEEDVKPAPAAKSEIEAMASMMSKFLKK